MGVVVKVVEVLRWKGIVCEGVMLNVYWAEVGYQGRVKRTCRGGDDRVVWRSRWRFFGLISSSIRQQEKRRKNRNLHEQHQEVTSGSCS